MMQAKEEDDEYWKKKNSGQIPEFGNWDVANQLPITQYFESARQAGLLRFTNSASSATTTSTSTNTNNSSSSSKGRQSVNNKKKVRGDVPSKLAAVVAVSDKSNRGGVPAGAGKQQISNNIRLVKVVNMRAVDEDLYKIPPEQLLHSSKRKKRLGFLPRCLMPCCMA